MIALLKQFSILHKERKQISVGLVGYPNVGKSSIINTLRGKSVCPTAPIPGETKVWRYVTLIKRIYLIDAPGIVPPNQLDTPEDILLRGVVRVENVSNPEQYIPAVLRKCKRHHIERTYELTDWENHIQFLELLARKGGRLLKAGEPDLDSVAKMVLNDFMRGKVPWFTPPPAAEGVDVGVAEGRAGRLGEMPKKRKLEESGSTPTTSTGEPTTVQEEEEGQSSDDDDFEGFESDDESESPEGEAGEGVKAMPAEDMIPLDVSSDEEVDEDDSDDEAIPSADGLEGDISEEEVAEKVTEPETISKKRRKMGR